MVSLLTRNSYFLLAILFACLWGFFLYHHGLEITGPFIFGDEETYFSFGRQIYHRGNLDTFTQYGPLYPSIISLFFSNDIGATYFNIRIMNIIIFISAIIPGLLLAKELFKDNALKLLLPFCIFLTPFSSLVYLIWADPLYLTIFYWVCYFFCINIKRPSIINSILLGVFLSLVYYAKPPSGLIVQIAACIALMIYTFTSKNRVYIFSIIVVLTCILAEMPWFLHYIALGKSIIGYAASSNIEARISQEGITPVALEVIRSSFYQFSYFFIGTWGMIGLLFSFLFTRWTVLAEAERTLLIFGSLSVLGLIALCAVGMSSYVGLDYHMAQGRYFSVLFPFLLTLALHILFQTSSQFKKGKYLLLFVIFTTTLIAIIASPLYTRSPLAYNSMPDLSPFIYLSDHGRIVWRPTIDRPSMLLRTNVALFFGLFAALILWLHKKSFARIMAVIIIICGIAYGAFTENYYLRSMAIGQSGINNVYLYLAKHNIDINNVGFDKKLEISNIPFMTHFWTNKTPNFYPSDNLKTVYFVTQGKLGYGELFKDGGYKLYKTEK